MRIPKDVVTSINISTSDSGERSDAAEARIGQVDCVKRGNIAVIADVDFCTRGIAIEKTSYIGAFTNRRASLNAEKGIAGIAEVINGISQARAIFCINHAAYSRIGWPAA